MYCTNRSFKYYNNSKSQVSNQQRNSEQSNLELKALKLDKTHSPFKHLSLISIATSQAHNMS